MLLLQDNAAIAQLVERVTSNDDVRSSNLRSSTSGGVGKLVKSADSKLASLCGFESHLPYQKKFTKK